MTDTILPSSPVAADLAWPLALAAGWLLGEFGHRLARIPRIASFGLLGFLLGPAQVGWLPDAATGPGRFVADLGFGLILFEVGHRTHLRWLRANPWIPATALLSAAGTFAAVLVVSLAGGASMLSALLLASLSISTSPAVLMRVVNETRSAGQVTERSIHVAAINAVLAVLTFKGVVGAWTYATSGDPTGAVAGAIIELVLSAALGVAAGWVAGAIVRSPGREASVAYALGVMAIVATAQWLRLSPVLASLIFGLTARHRRVAFGLPERGFGTLGDVLAVGLFMFVASTLEWPRVLAGAWLGLALVVVRSLVQVGVATGLARASGVSWRKGALTGAALAPISVFVLLVLEQQRYLGLDLVDRLAPLGAMTLVLELAGPVVASLALDAARETREATDRALPRDPHDRPA